MRKFRVYINGEWSTMLAETRLECLQKAKALSNVPINMFEITALELDVTYDRNYWRSILT